MDKFKLENLGSGITAVISKEHGFGTDALLLADFAAVKESNRCCDMGSGCRNNPAAVAQKEYEQTRCRH